MRRISIAVAACALAASWSAAPARVVTMTARSSAFSGNDITGFFGVGPSLANQAASLTLTYDTDAAPFGVAGHFTDNNAFSGNPSWLGLTLTVAGTNFVYNSGPLGFSIIDVQLTENGAQDLFYLNWSRATYPPVPGASTFAESLGLYFVGDLFNSVATLPELNGTYLFSPNQSSAGFYVRDLICGSTCVPVEFDGNLQLDAGRFTTAAPEPATLAILGAGLLGLAVRRRRG